MATYKTHRRDPHSGARYHYRALPTAGGKVRWLGTVQRGGKRWRFTGESKGVVEEKVAIKLTALAQDGVGAVQLSSDERMDAARAMKYLLEGESLADALSELRDCRRLLGLVDADGTPQGTGGVRGRVAVAVKEYATVCEKLGGRVTLEAAASFWTVRNPDGSGVSLGEARNAFLAEAERTGVHSYTTRLGARLEAFAGWLGKGNVKDGDTRAVVSLEAGDVEAFLEDHRRQCEAGLLATSGGDGQKQPRPLSFKEATRNKWIVTFKHFFHWATRRYKLPIDPSSQLETRRRKGGAPTIVFIHAEEVQKLLRAAERVRPEYVPAMAILFFAGLRPAELIGKYEGKGRALPGLDWTCVDRDEQIVVESRTTKTKQRRVIPVEPNLRQWLLAYAPRHREGLVVRNPTAWRKARDAIVAAAGVEIPQDGPRHTYATMHFGKYHNRERLEANLGHSQGSGVLEANYKSLVTGAEAERFWKIMPKGLAGKRKEGGKCNNSQGAVVGTVTVVATCK